MNLVCQPFSDRRRRFAVSLPTAISVRSRRGVFAIAAVMGAMAVHVSAATAEPPMPAHERIIRGYFGGWERKDWNEVARHLAPEFTFTSPAPDDHLSTAQFKAKCWNQAEHIARFEFPKIVGDDREAMAIVHVVTRDGRVIRNVEFFTFRDGRIASIEVFFGGGGQGFPTYSK